MLTHTSFDFAGKQLDAVMTETGEVFITLASISRLSSSDASNAHRWARKFKADAETISFGKGLRNSQTKAYPAKVCVEYLIYRLSLGDKAAFATFTATLLADLERSAKEASGVQVTAAQHEETRTSERERILARFIEAKLGILPVEEREEANAVKLEEGEYAIYKVVADQVNIHMNEWSKANWMEGTDRYKQERQTTYDQAIGRVKAGELKQMVAEQDAYWEATSLF